MHDGVPIAGERLSNLFDNRSITQGPPDGTTTCIAVVPGVAGARPVRTMPEEQAEALDNILKDHT